MSQKQKKDLTTVPSAQLRRRAEKLIEQEKCEKAIPLLEELLGRFPEEPEMYQQLAMCYEEVGEVDRGIEITQQAVDRFPNDIGVLVDHAEILFFNNRFERAEQVYRRLLTLVDPNDKKLRSDFLSNLGETLWEENKRAEALDAWKEALVENPENEEARFLLTLRTNELESRHSDAMEGMTAEEKAAFFQSAHVDFSQPVRNTKRATKKKGKQSPIQLTAAEQRFLQQLDARFGFLPPNGGAKLLLFGFPALAASGITNERLAELLKGDRPSADEEETMEWAYDIVDAVLRATFEKGNREEIEAMMDAMEIAREQLDEEDAVFVVQTIRQAIEMIDEEK